MKIIKEFLDYLIIILVVVLIRTFFITFVKVSGTSMNPTLNHNDFLILKKYDKSIERFDVVVLKYSNDKLIKRVIGMPGEKIRISVTKVGNSYVSNIYINGQLLDESFGSDNIESAGMAASEITLGRNEYFVLGDNRNNSSDSRIIGPINKKDIVGVTNFRVFPFSKIGGFN